MGEFKLLQSLPEELLQGIINYVPRSGLQSLSLTSKWCYQKALPLLWREVHLVDCRTEDAEGLFDDHDDTPMIKKFLILATNPSIASCVQVLEHRCHLPPPAIFNELPRAPFSSQTLSTDPRTNNLAKHAVWNMKNVQTLRIIFGHPTLNDTLLRCFFDSHRDRSTPVRKLWLENCRINAGCDVKIVSHPYDLPLELDFTGLENVRFRRLPLRPAVKLDRGVPKYNHVYARSVRLVEMQDGFGGQYQASTNDLVAEQAMGVVRGDYDMRRHIDATFSNLSKFYHRPNTWDDAIYEKLYGYLNELQIRKVEEGHVESHDERSKLAYRGIWLDPVSLEEDQFSDLSDYPALKDMLKCQRERRSASTVAIDLLRSTSSTLTSLNLDWVYTMPASLGYTRDTDSELGWIELFSSLFTLRFPHLRAFQIRNAVVAETYMPQGLYLLDHSSVEARYSSGEYDDKFALAREDRESLDLAGLRFMESHPKLQCLAWPMEHFFSARRSIPGDIADRVEKVIDTLGRNLTELRVDSMYRWDGESQSENAGGWVQISMRDQRRKFIQHFAAKMKKLTHLKIEGGVPRDERREILRAVHQCPLQKLVMIGVCCPIGNTWGLNGVDLPDHLSQGETENLESEDKDAIWQMGPRAPTPPGSDFRFEPTYGWPASAPLLHTIASFHAATITELKFCGYKGAPVLFSPTPITEPMLAPLVHFSNLETLIMSFWLPTRFEQEARDHEVISYWLNSRSPTSTALVRLADNDEELEGWEKELRTKFAPDALAWRVTGLVGPYLSPQAKKRPGGVEVRASFCVGDWGGIFDIDVRVGMALGNVCLGFEGPREELESGRRKGKIEGRRWF